MKSKGFYLLGILFVLLLLGSCDGGDKSTSDTPFPVETVKLGDGHYQEALTELTDSVSFIPLEESEASYLSTISKIKIKGGRIFVFDKLRSNSVVSFDKNGHHVIRYGERGNGNKEYISLADFDVDENYVYLYDYVKMRMLQYRHTGEYVKARATKFRGKGFHVLGNGKFLFAMEKEDNLQKLCLVDYSMTVGKCLLTYKEEEACDKWTDNFFQSCGKDILYNDPVNDSIYIISAAGEITDCKVMDFGGYNVPNDLKLSYEKLTASDGKEKYTYLYDCPLLVKGEIVGSTFDRGGRSCILFDLDKGIGGRSEWKEGMRISDLVLPLCATKEWIVGWMDYGVYGLLGDKDNVPADVVTHLEKGGRSLIFYHLKNKK